MNIVKTFWLLCVICSLAACGTQRTADGLAEDGETPESMYAKAKKSLDRKDYERAIEQYETLEARFPFGPYSQQALLDSAYAYYKFAEPDSAILTIDRFIKLYPQHRELAYAYYLKGLADFDRGKGFLEKWIPRDPSDKDPAPLRRSFEDFAVVLENFPESRYAEDSRQRMIYLRNQLAAFELHVADYYLRRGAWVAAINRSKYVLENYQGADSTPEALTTLIKAYRKLELEGLANDALRVLQQNYPGAVSLL